MSESDEEWSPWECEEVEVEQPLIQHPHSQQVCASDLLVVIDYMEDIQYLQVVDIQFIIEWLLLQEDFFFFMSSISRQHL